MQLRQFRERKKKKLFVSELSLLIDILKIMSYILKANKPKIKQSKTINNLILSIILTGLCMWMIKWYQRPWKRYEWETGLVFVCVLKLKTWLHFISDGAFFAYHPPPHSTEPHFIFRASSVKSIQQKHLQSCESALVYSGAGGEKCTGTAN